MEDVTINVTIQCIHTNVSTMTDGREAGCAAALSAADATLFTERTKVCKPTDNLSFKERAKK